MIRVSSLYDLKTQPPTNDIVFVKTVNKLYRYIDGEWIERAYYTTEEIANILGVSVDRMRRVLIRLNIKNKLFRTSNINYEQLILISKAMKMKKEKPCMKYSEIKLKLKL